MSFKHSATKEYNIHYVQSFNRLPRLCRPSADLKFNLLGAVLVTTCTTNIWLLLQYRLLFNPEFFLHFPCCLAHKTRSSPSWIYKARSQMPLHVYEPEKKSWGSVLISTLPNSGVSATLNLSWALTWGLTSTHQVCLGEKFCDKMCSKKVMENHMALMPCKGEFSTIAESLQI